MCAASLLEELVATFRLAVVRILHLDPRRCGAIRLVSAQRPFRDDALDVVFAGKRDQRSAVTRDGRHPRNASTRHRQEIREQRLAAAKRERAQIAAFEAEHLEGGVARRRAAEQQVM